MAFEPNEEQKEFLKSNKCNVLVSASAGSGKTSTMIQKLMQILINDKVSIDRLLVLTFTDAAASEIKQKLYTAISESMSSLDPKEKEFSKKQLDGINSAEIGTLHSVCKKLIVKYFYEIDESPDFVMLSDKESKYLIYVAINDVFEKYIISADEDFYVLYNSYNAKRNDNNLKKIILSLFDYLRNKANSKEWIESIIEKVFTDDLNENIACRFIFDYTKKQLVDTIKKVDQLINISECNGYEKYTSFLQNKKQSFDEILNSKNYTQMQKIIFDLPSLTKPKRNNKDDAMLLDFDEEVDLFNKQTNEILKNIKTIFIYDNETSTIDSLNSSKKNTLFLLKIVWTILDEYNEIKKKKNVLDFNDLEDKMIELLGNQKIREILQKKYQFIFFDEYQDINEKQELILSKLVSGDNYYMIGDVKQSIYAFRQSSPKIFVNKFYDFSHDGVNNKVINFNKNYRSDKNILEFNNIIFDKLITENTIGIDYKNNSRFESNKEFEKCNVEMTIINSKSDGEEDLSLEEKECLVIANNITKLIHTKKSDGNYFDYKDIAIIVRKRGTFVKTLCDKLSAMQIPINAVVSGDFFASSEINLMTSITKVAVNYKDDIVLASVLKNLFDISDKELMDIKKIGNDNFFDCVKNFSETNDTKCKIDKFYEFLEWAKLFLSKNTTSEYLQNVVNKFDLIIKLKSMPNGIEKVNNVIEFINIADNDNYKYNINKFVEYLNFVSKDTQLQKIGDNANSVQIMTIHYSKGLEYPAVILAGLGKKFTINKDTNDIVINENFGFGLKNIDAENRTLSETIIRNACKLANKESELNEEIRLLYVAMTRPKEYLSLIGTYDLENFQKNQAKDIYSAKNYFDMIFKAVDKNYYLFFENEQNFVLNRDLPSCCNVNFVNPEDIIQNSSDSSKHVILGEYSKQDLEKLKYVLDNPPNTNTYTIKNTVTNILNEEKDYENLSSYPCKLDSSDKIDSKDAMTLGTAYHSVMQYVKFTENLAEIQDLINNLVSQNIIAKDVADRINPIDILNAIENLKDYVLSADKVYKERQFVMQQNYNKIVKNSDNNTKVIVQGIIDLVVVKDGVATLIDYKTNKTNNADLLISNYQMQLDIYSQAFEKATNIAIKKKFLYSFYMEKLLEIK